MTAPEDTDIVVGVDGSEPARVALRWAAAQARLTGARLHAVIAWEYPVTAGWVLWPAEEDLAGAAGKVLSRAVHEALGPDPDIAVVETVLPGHPAQVLIEQSEHAALLVVGSHGHGGFGGALLGSVSRHCTNHAECPVVVVRTGSSGVGASA